MLSFACAVLLKVSVEMRVQSHAIVYPTAEPQFKSMRNEDNQSLDRSAGDLAKIASELKEVANMSSHHLGVVRWHAEFFETAVASLEPGPQLSTTWDDLLREMAMPTFPANLMDIMSLDWQNWETDTDLQPWQLPLNDDHPEPN